MQFFETNKEAKNYVEECRETWSPSGKNDTVFAFLAN